MSMTFIVATTVGPNQYRKLGEVVGSTQAVAEKAAVTRYGPAAVVLSPRTWAWLTEATEAAAPQLQEVTP